MRIEEVTSYEIIEKREIQDLNSMSYLLRTRRPEPGWLCLRMTTIIRCSTSASAHRRRTPPAWPIFWSTPCCAIQEFPVKDPFVELVKGL